MCESHTQNLVDMIKEYKTIQSAKFLNDLIDIERRDFRPAIKKIHYNEDFEERELERYLNHLEMICLYYYDGVIKENHFEASHVAILRKIKQNNILDRFDDEIQENPKLYCYIRDAINDLVK